MGTNGYTRKIKYRLYATLLDAFRSYVDSDVIYDKYWGFSENPPHTPEEFHEQKFQEFIDTLNRKPFDSEVADRGTVFNEMIDCIVGHYNSDKVQISKVPDETGKVVALKGEYNNRVFTFPLDLVMEVANYYKDALPQQFIEGILPTRFGDVLLYGYIDYVTPFCTHDLKTTGKYSVGNYKHHAQHLVYPYCLYQQGANVEMFEYNIVELNRNCTSWSTFTETYNFNEERDIPRLTQWVEDLIDFIEEHKDLIKNDKLFNYDRQ